MKSPAILVADDDPEVLSYLETALLCHKYPVIAAQDGSEALSLLEENRESVSAVVLDVMMPCKDGIETLVEVRRRFPEMPVIMISGASDPDRIVEAMKAGAQEYLTKPVVHEKLLDALRKNLPLRQEVSNGNGTAVEPPAQPANYVQVNSRMRAISEALRKTAAWNVPVVLRGESGVGKEVLARELHLLSPRSEKEFVKINCVALPSELLESELFGYERGAFTGAFKAKPGKFEMADGGTILLDEIGDMDLKLQAKLLQVLQDGEFHRLGGKEPVRVDVRVLVATHRDLEKAIEEGTFREDLYYRLNVVSIEVPPLRERKDEILPLAHHFLEKHSPPDMPPPELTEELKLALLTHDWPGNVRELENVVRRYLVFEDAPRLARQLLQGRSARVTARPSDDAPFYDAAAARAPEETNGHPAVTQWKAAAAAAGSSAAGESWQSRQHVRTNGSHHGTSHSMPAPQPADSGHAYETPRLPFPNPSADRTPARAETNGANGASVGGTRDFEAAPNGVERRNLDGLTSRLAHLEDLLGRLVAQTPETKPAAEAIANEQSVEQNGHRVVTLGELDELRNQAESDAIVAALDQTEWNRKKAAKLLKTDYKALLYRMKKLGIGERNDEI
jgi:two-component system response regulator AtoC